MMSSLGTDKRACLFVGLACLLKESILMPCCIAHAKSTNPDAVLTVLLLCAQSTDLTDKQVLPTLLSGQTLTVDLSTPGKVKIVGANSTATVVTPDVAANQVCPSFTHCRTLSVRPYVRLCLGLLCPARVLMQGWARVFKPGLSRLELGETSYRQVCAVFAGFVSVARPSAALRAFLAAV